MATTRASSLSHGSIGGTRSPAAGLVKLFLLAASQISIAAGAPVGNWLMGHGGGEDLPKSPDDPSLWIYLTIAMVLVISGGAFAGLTIALMGQDGIYLQVIATSGEGKEQRHAQKVLNLLNRGKHWVLVTLLLANVIVNETLPIILDRSLGGGWPAVLGSTALIVIFGEVIPQSICVRYGLSIGAFMAPVVLAMMYILAPIAWPTAKLLDYLLGEDHGTVYKKSGLKTLVTLHKTLGTSPSDRLNQDEVTIISAVLDLKDKPVGSIMTPMQDVFTMSADTVLDEETMDGILSAGYSRIPIYEPGNSQNFIGMLLVKILITYDPEDCKKVGEFALATLPETRPETSCLDIVNFFQEGKSHMVLVSEYPGEDHGATGVVTLEDVIEELIGEEIIDESDVYIDVHKAIRRLAPAPTYRRAPKGQIVEEHTQLKPADDKLIDIDEDNKQGDFEQPKKPLRVNSLDVRRSSDSPASGTHSSSLPKASFIMRRGSSAADGNHTVRGSIAEMREQLKNIGPSNLASRPKSTRYSTVKIKPAQGYGQKMRNSSVSSEPYHDDPDHHDENRAIGAQGGEGEGLLRNAGRGASDGVQALHQGYGSIERGSPSRDTKDKAQNVNFDGAEQSLAKSLPGKVTLQVPGQESSGTETVQSLSDQAPKKRGIARSGSITENVVDANGVRKVVLQTTSSSDEDSDDESKPLKGKENEEESSKKDEEDEEHAEDGASVVKKKKKTKRNRRRGKAGAKTH